MLTSDVSVHILLLINITNALKDISQYCLYLCRRDLLLLLNVTTQLSLVSFSDQVGVLAFDEDLIQVDHMTLFLQVLQHFLIILHVLKHIKTGNSLMMHDFSMPDLISLLILGVEQVEYLSAFNGLLDESIR